MLIVDTAFGYSLSKLILSRKIQTKKDDEKLKELKSLTA